jgi:hypothetical protein
MYAFAPGLQTITSSSLKRPTRSVADAQCTTVHAYCAQSDQTWFLRSGSGNQVFDSSCCFCACWRSFLSLNSSSGIQEDEVLGKMAKAQAGACLVQASTFKGKAASLKSCS